MRSVYLSWEFWAQTLERAVKTFAQSAVALIGTQLVGVTDLDWVQIASVAAVAAVVSVLTSIGSAPIGSDKASPSLL